MPSVRWAIAAATVVVMVLGGGGTGGCEGRGDRLGDGRSDGRGDSGAGASASDTSNSDFSSDPARALNREPASGFERITAPRPFVFPEDHGPHPETQTEWWYVTGNVTAEDGRRFGYQFTIFRLGLVPPDALAQGADSSAWSVGDLYMAHAALSDLGMADLGSVAGAQASKGNRSFVAQQRLTRPALELAGARAQPFRVWLEDWELRSTNDGSFFPLSLRASIGSTDGGTPATLDLVLDDGKPMALHGDRGYSRKGANAGDASHYYSFTRMPTRGSITIDGDRVAVTGDSWLDREWSTSVLSRSQRGWDWFGLHLADGRDVMFFELRSDDESTAVRDGTVVGVDGETTRIDRNDAQLEVLDEWSSPVDGALYPSAWRLRVPGQGIDIRIDVALADQEHTELFRYWEGAVRLSTPAGEPAGWGYAELTGYGTGSAR